VGGRDSLDVPASRRSACMYMSTTIKHDEARDGHEDRLRPREPVDTVGRATFLLSRGSAPVWAEHAAQSAASIAEAIHPRATGVAMPGRAAEKRHRP